MSELNPFLNKYLEAEGFYCLSSAAESKKWQDNYFTASQIQEANNYIQENKWLNCYGSIATFLNSSRSLGTVLRPLELFADVDSHIYSVSKEEVLEYLEILKKHFNKDIPEPSSVVFTGRGFQLHFELNKHSEIDVTKWKEAQKALCNTLDSLVSNINVFLGSEFSMDFLTDSTRVLRIPETYNTKAGKFSKVIYTSGRKYSLEEIYSDYGTMFYYEKRGKKEVKVTLKDLANISSEEILKASPSQLKKYKSKTKGFTVETLARARIQDFITLIHLRNAQGITEGYRNNLLNLVCETALNITSNANEIKNTLEAINKEFSVPLNEAEVRKWIQLKASHNQYYFKTKRIIERLKITEEEQAKMKTLIRRELVNSNYYRKNRETLLKKRNRKYLDIKDRNAEERTNRILIAQELRKQGASIKTIMTALKVSRRTVYYYLKESV